MTTGTTSADVAAVHRAMHVEPASGVVEIAQRLGMTEAAVQAAVDLLADRELGSAPQDAAVPAARIALAEMPDRYGGPAHETTGIEPLNGADQAHQRLTELAWLARHECWSLVPDGGAEQDLTRVATARGLEVCCVYQTGCSDDPGTVAHLRWLATSGGKVRTVAAIPLPVVIVDRAIAVLPFDAADLAGGVVEVRNPAVLLAVCALFRQVWERADPIPATNVGGTGLTRMEADTLRLLAEGYTTESVARRLGMSGSSVRRIAADLTGRLRASSRFQAGVAAARAGWV